MLAVNWGNAYKIVPISKPVDEVIEPQLQPWYQRFAPTSVDDIVGNDDAVSTIKTWFSNKQPLLIVHGSTGTGKSCCVTLTAKQHGRRLIAPDISEIVTVAGLTGYLRKADTEKAFLFLDDVHHMANHAPTCYAYLLKVIKQELFRVKIACCYDGDAMMHPKMTTLSNATTEVAEFDKIETRDLSPYLSKVCRQAGSSLGYFDALAICQSSDGDVRTALIRLEYLYNSRKIDLQARAKQLKRKRIKDDHRVLVSGNGTKQQNVINMLSATDNIVKNKNVNKVIIAESVEGVDYARSLADSVHKKWLLHNDASVVDESICDVTDAMSMLDVMLSEHNVDAEAADDLEDAKQTAYGFRPQTAVAYLCDSVSRCKQIVTAKPEKRRKKTKMEFW